MKKAIFRIQFLVKTIILFGCLLSLASFSTPPKKHSKFISEAEFSVMAENIVEDSISLSIIHQDLQREVFKIINSAKFTNEKWQQIAAKKKWSEKEADTLFSFFGFKNSADLSHYIDLKKAFDIKYGKNFEDIKSFNFFKDIFQKKQQEYIRKNKLFEEEYLKQLSLTGGMPPECWKCVYDYRDCMNQTGSYSINYQTGSSVVTVEHVSSAGVPMVVTVFETPTRATITYTAATIPVSGCYPIYKNCIGSCMN